MLCQHEIELGLLDCTVDVSNKRDQRQVESANILPFMQWLFVRSTKENGEEKRNKTKLTYMPHNDLIIVLQMKLLKFYSHIPHLI